MQEKISFESLFRELLTPIVREAVNKAMEKYHSTSTVPQPAAKEILDVDDAATFLGVLKSRVYKMTHRKEVPYYSTGKYIYFKREDLVQLVTKHRISSREEIKWEAINYVTLNRRKH